MNGSEVEQRILEDAFRELDEANSSLQQHWNDAIFSCMASVIARHGIDDESVARDLMRKITRGWEPTTLSKQELDARRVTAAEMEGSEFDLKRADRDGESLTLSIRAIRSGPVKWTLSSESEWSALELRQLLAKIAEYYDAKLKDERDHETME